MNKTKIIFIIVVAVLLVSNIFFVVRELKFPIKLMVCGVGYVNCFVVAKFDDVDSCQTTNEKWGWLCDSTNPNNIQCRVPSSGETFSTGYCTK